MSNLLKKVQKATNAMGKGPYDDKKMRAAVAEATEKAMDWYEKNKHKLVEKDKAEVIESFREGLISGVDLFRFLESEKCEVKSGKSFIDLTTEEITASFTEAVTEAIAETHALGLPTTHGDGENIFRIYPDGHKEIIEKCGD